MGRDCFTRNAKRATRLSKADELEVLSADTFRVGRNQFGVSCETEDAAVLSAGNRLICGR